MPSPQFSRYHEYLRGLSKPYRLQIMIIAKLVLFASPMLVASMLFTANPAVAFPVDSVSGTADVNAVSTQQFHHLLVLNKADNSNPILEQLGCKCATCNRAKLQFEGKLSISDML